MPSNTKRRRLLNALLATAGIAALAACGQKGPLYLPEQRADPKKKKETTGGLPGAGGATG